MKELDNAIERLMESKKFEDMQIVCWLEWLKEVSEALCDITDYECCHYNHTKAVEIAKTVVGVAESQ